MKKKLTMIVLVLVCALALSACGCKHETWNEANCETPKTCAECGEIEGAPLGHSWMAATCETAKTCEVCGKTEGEALGHSWADADCETAKTCSTCKLTEGEALGHSWQEATTEAPKTCATCAKTEGERIITDERFTTASTRDLQGKWSYAFNMSGEMMDLDGFDAGFDCILYLELKNDGTAVMTIAPLDIAVCEKDITDYLTKLLYDEMAVTGYGKDAADEAFRDAYGVNVDEYAAYLVKEMKLASVFQQMRVDYVYYVEGDQLYLADSWEQESVTPSPYSLEGDVLTIHEDLSLIGIEDEAPEFTRVVE